MIQTIKLLCLTLAMLLFFMGIERPSAQTIGYAEAIDRLAVSCGKDIDKYCKKINLGGGRIQQCLDQNQGVSAVCKTTVAQVRVLLQKRAAARAAVTRICDTDMRKLCAGIQPGDGNLLECFYKVKGNASAACQRAVTDAGYE